LGYNNLCYKASDVANNAEEPLKENKEKIDIESLLKQNEALQDQNQNLTVHFNIYINIQVL